MDVEKLSNTELVKVCGQQPQNPQAWKEFCLRFDDRIRLTLYRECRQRQLTQKAAAFDELFQDLAQEVYLKLVENEARALKEFRGTAENSIFVYLGVIARNVVLNHLISLGAQKRPQIIRSLDETVSDHDARGGAPLKERYRAIDDDLVSEIDLAELREEIDEILSRRLKGKHAARDRLVFRLYFEHGFSPKEISEHFGLGVSTKTVGNIISLLKQILRQELLDQRNPGA